MAKNARGKKVRPNESARRVMVLKCIVQKGMFSDESVVIVKSVKGDEYSFFVHKKDVSPHGVRVQVFQQKDTVLAMIPTSEQDAVLVAEKYLEEESVLA
jgi:hypothetical protein